MKHTPGPWKWVEYPNNLNEKGKYEMDMPQLKNELGEEVCNFGSSEQYYPTEGSPPGDADAKLIAAAPDLLEALQDILGHVPIGKDYFTVGESNSMLKAEAAIKKATT